MPRRLQCYSPNAFRLCLWIVLFFLIEQYANGFSNFLAPIGTRNSKMLKFDNRRSLLTSAMLKFSIDVKNSHRSLTSVVVVNAARRRRADDTATNTTDTTANPTLRGTRNRHFGQKKRTWMQSYEALLEFKRLKQHCRVPQRYSHDPPLGTWCQTLRRNGRESLSSEQLKLLDDVGFDWETQEERNNRLWQESYQKLIEYKEVHGNCCVPRMYNDDKALGIWVQNQRRSAKEGRLRVDREEQLEAIGFTWSLKDAPENNNTTYVDSRWDEMYDRLLEFRGKWGHCLVPLFFEDDPSLGSWVNTQRRMFKRGSLQPDRKDRLEEIGFEFDPSNSDENLFDRQWNSMFQHLVDYKAKHGDTNVKWRHKEFGLGKWVKAQRRRKSTMDQHRKRRLDDIGFMWTSPHFTWQERFDQLCKHSKLHGTCRVNGKENPGLAQWVTYQRCMIKKGKLSESKVKKMESIGFE